MLHHPAILALLALLPSPQEEEPLIGVGDPAPAIEVERFLKGEPFEEFEKEHTYVVEFWASWCPPCVQSIPQLTKLQRKYADSVTIVGVSVMERDRSAIVPFVERMGDRIGYTVALDRERGEGEEGAMAEGWMAATGQTSIPTAFIVRDARIQWIGPPKYIDGPLEKVVAGHWNLDAEIARARREAELRPLTAALRNAQHRKNWKAALGVVDEIIGLDPRLATRFGAARFECFLRLESFRRAYAYGKELVAGPLRENAEGLNMVAWIIVDPNALPRERDLDLALIAAVRADELTAGQDPMILDTLARVLFLRGSLSRALELQRKAVELVEEGSFPPTVVLELRSRLADYESAVDGEAPQTDAGGD